jgi:hypothetical protein
VKVFMGDDTWINLLPNTFSKVTALPSLNIHELDSVDDAIWQV